MNKHKKKIVYISHDPGMAGAPRSLLNMITSMRDGVEPIVIIPRKGQLENYLIKYGIEYMIVPFMCDFFSCTINTDIRCLLKDNYKAAFEIYSKLKDSKIVVIHSNTSVENVGVFLAYLLKVPHVWHIREFVEEDFDAHYADPGVKKKMFEASSCVITISNALRYSVEEKYGLETICLHNGVECNMDRIRFDRKALDSAMISGTIHPGKGQFDAVRAVRILRQRGIKLNLTIVGWGGNAYSWMLHEYINKYDLQDRIRILDYVDDLSELRKNSLLSLTCSKNEALGRCTIEAMYAGQFIIGTDSAGTAEIVGETGDRGLLYTAGDANELADRIEEYMKMDDAQRISILDNAYKYALGEFSVEKYCKRIKEIYSDLQEKGSYVDNTTIELLIREFRLCDEDENVKLSEDKPTAYKELLGERDMSDIIKQLKGKVMSIYGMGNWGIAVYEACRKNNLLVKAVFDKGAGYLEEILPIRKIGEEISDVDVIVVCVERQEKEIVSYLKQIYTCEIKGLSYYLGR